MPGARRTLISITAFALVLPHLARAAAAPESPPAPAGEAAEARRHPRLVLIGIDGASLNLLEPYVARGVTPRLGALLEEGASADFASYWPLRTPQVWTSVVTGKLPGQHGLWDHVSHSAYNPPPFRTKERRALTTRERRSKALWQLLSDAGISSLVVGWISSWPAEEVEHATIVAPAMLVDDKRQSSIKGSFFRDAPDQVQPARWWPRVRELIVEPQDVTAEDLRRYADVPPPGHALLRLPYLERYLYGLRWSIARESTVERVTTTLAAELEPDVVLTYFQCSDSLLHRFWIFQRTEAEIRERLSHHRIDARRAGELHQRFGGVVEACYRDIDAGVGRLLDAVRGPETLVLVVSDHGFGEAPKPHPSRDEPYGGNHRDDGLIIAAGPGVSRDTPLGGASVLDVTPTVLQLFGLPVADDMRGKPIPALRPRTAVGPSGRVPTYEAQPQLEVPYAEGWPERKQRPLAIDR